MLDLDITLSEAVKAMFDTNGGSDGISAQYGVLVHNYSPSESSFDLELTFLGGESYCCTESGCHFGFFDDKWFTRLAVELRSLDWSESVPLRIRSVTVYVEEGVMLAYPQQTTDEPWSYRLGPFESGRVP